jgi:uncharacterized protein (DUF2147 family)
VLIGSEFFTDRIAVQIWNLPTTKLSRCVLTGAVILLLPIGAAIAQQTAAAPSADPTGEWLVEKQIARIRIVDCDGKLWGVVSWEARPGIDKNNQDRSMRSRPTLGMPILLGMSRVARDRWDGQIYNSEDGRTYDASVRLLDPDTLKVEGCVLGFLCGGENWTRVGPPESDQGATSPPPSGTKQPTGKTQRGKVKDGTQATRPPVGRRGSASPQTPPQPATAESIAAESAADICSRVVGLPGLAH